ncbi:alpha/beta fold hydrolase [Massilia sp. Dwa41.01b]|uniref:alpha/beta fold hydrolase n=1 Tax=Massilia sp. Dwa41.01b TaxID=2709302 RepID=UPI00191D4620|nr:alpha/beta hydrolase [Massilia sp. Dwa41.01b]
MPPIMPRRRDESRDGKQQIFAPRVHGGAGGCRDGAADRRRPGRTLCFRTHHRAHRGHGPGCHPDPRPELLAARLGLDRVRGARLPLPPVQVAGFADQPAGANKEGLVAAPVAEEIARYIAESGLSKPAVIGHSMGGTMGMMLAARHPQALSRLMVVDMVPYMGPLFAGPGASAQKVESVADGIAAGMRAATPEQRSKRAGDTIAGMVNTEAMRAGATADSLASDPDVGVRAYRELIVTDLTPELAKITVPVTVLYVQPKSVPIPAAMFDGFYKTAYAPVKSLNLKRIEDSAHFIMWDQPQRFQGEVKAFLGTP